MLPKHFKKDPKNSCSHESEGSKDLRFKHRTHGMQGMTPRQNHSNYPKVQKTITTQRSRRGVSVFIGLLFSLTETMSIQREKKHFANQAELLLNERFTTASCKLFSDSTQQEQKHSGGGAGTREKSGQRRDGRRG